jgi:hypothetical protein
MPTIHVTTRCWLWLRETPVEFVRTEALSAPVQTHYVEKLPSAVVHSLSNAQVEPRRVGQLCLAAVARFFRRPYSEHGIWVSNGAGGGRFQQHDWIDLVQEISRIQNGCEQSTAVAERIAKDLRGWYPNNADWNQVVNGIGVHKQILGIIERRLARIGSKGQPAIHSDSGTAPEPQQRDDTELTEEQKKKERNRAKNIERKIAKQKAKEAKYRRYLYDTRGWV